MKCKTCEEYVLTELEFVQKILEQVKECVDNTAMSPNTKIEYIKELLSKI